MAITDENGGIFNMPVVPAYASGNGFGGFGGDWGWIILLLLCANGGWGGFGGFGGGMMNYDFPWLMTGQQNINTNTNNGFRDAMINDNITSVRDGISSLSTQLCGCCGDMQMALANGFANAEQGANARAMSNMQSLFGIQSQLADASAENRLAICQTNNTIQGEAAETRFANATNTRDILEATSNSTRAVLDKLCQLELDSKQQKIDDLQRELTAEQFKASQVAQNAFITQGFNNEVDALYNRLSNCPVPTTPVYGRTPIFTCGGNNCGTNCGCGVA